MPAITKSHILAEIKRTAKANGGVPLGFRRFCTETGIKEFDWLGRYWARWSDAVREAGFTPNQLQGAYDDSELLEKYAMLTQELGRLPADGDLRFKANNDPEFPSDKPFRRFGRKRELVATLADYCRDRAEYQAVVRLCEQYAPRTRDVASKSVASDVEIGFVYLIKSGRFYKIGKTNAIGRREYELAVQLPESVTTVHVIRTDDPAGIEAYWHKRFEAKRKKGEWFELDAADIAAFKRRKFM
jgi:hypothetical protein